MNTNPQNPAILEQRVAVPTTPPHKTVVMLHGRAGDENVMWVFARTVPKNWLIIAPRAIFPDPDGGFSWALPASQPWPSLIDFDAAVDALKNFLDTQLPLNNATPEIYLMGFSQGAALAYAFARREPQRVRGIAGLVGFTPENMETESENQPLKNLPIFAAAGRLDETVPLTRSQHSAQVLQKLGVALDYREYNTKHKVDAAGMRDLQVWWQKQSETEIEK